MANPYLQVEEGAEAKRYELGEGVDEVIVGRASECHWVITSGAVSRRHARVRRRGGEITLEDLGSSNGTFINGERLSEAKVVRDQDKIQLGSVEARFFVPKPVTASDATIIGGIPPTIMIPPGATVLAPRAAPEPTPPKPAASAAPEGMVPAEPGPTPAIDTGTRAAPPPPPALDTGTRAVPAPEPSDASTRPTAPPVDTSTHTVPPPEMRPTPQPAPAKASPLDVAPGQTAFRPAPAPAPVVSPAKVAAATAAPSALGAAASPSLIELAVIAAASFLVVFALGAVVLRFVF